MFRIIAIILLFVLFNLGFVGFTQLSSSINLSLERPSPSPKRIGAQEEVLGAQAQPNTQVTISAIPQTVTLPILTYHYIRVVQNPSLDPVGYNLSVSPEIFRVQMQYLKDHGYNPISLDKLDKGVSGLEDLPPRPVVLTFDDGYGDFYTHAYPILREFNFPAVVFVVSDFTGDPRYLTATEIKELSNDSLITIGVHSATHPDLKRFGIDTMKEILGSKAKLEEITGKKLDFFAYPYGSFNIATKELVKNSGFRLAVSTNGGFIHNENTRFELKRNNVDSTWYMFGNALGE